MASPSTTNPTAAPTIASARACPSCGASAPGGRFCPECGASLDGGACTACRAQLEPGARFCHRCGTAVGSVPASPALLAGPNTPRPLSAVIPWAIAGLAIVALLAFMVGRNLGGGLTAPAGAEAQSAEGPDATGGAGAGGAPQADGGVRPPDISSMSPEERADRLYDRVMRLSEEGKTDSVDFFAPMVMSAYQMLGSLNLDQHYDLGRIGEVTGATSLARAEADTILRSDPTHLLGLALAARLASDAHEQGAARSYYRRLVASAAAERAKNLPEYSRHATDIDAALAEARRQGVGGT